MTEPERPPSEAPPRDASAPLLLRGIEVAFTGRLASMDRDTAAERVRQAGGRVVPEVTTATALLVIGQGGPPLGPDGKLTKALRRARVLQEIGRSIDVVGEEEFLSRLGLERRAADLHRVFTTAQLARMLDVPQATVRAWTRFGLLEPARVFHRLCFFEFRQVAMARELCRLAASGIGAHRLRRSLEVLRRWLPEANRPLAQLEAIERRGAVLVRLDDGRLAEAGGQLRLEFGKADAEAAAEHGAASGATAAGAGAASRGRVRSLAASRCDWFDAALAAEEAGRLEDARTAYERALVAAPRQPEIHFNLGNVLFALANKDEAARRFRDAVTLEPDYVEAWNNLGNALADLGRLSESIVAYRRALAIAPSYADAHYNLAETLALQDDLHGARRHWLAYLEQDPNSSWAVHVRERLDGK